MSQISQISISDQNEEVIFSDNEHDETTYRSQTQEIERILSNVMSQLDKDDINEIEDKCGNEKLEKDKKKDLEDHQEDYEKDQQEEHQVEIQRENDKIDYLVLDDIESQSNKSIDEFSELSECSSIASCRSFRKFKLNLKIFGEVIKDENGNLSVLDQIYLEQCQVWFKRETRKRKGQVNCIFSQIIKNKIVKS